MKIFHETNISKSLFENSKPFFAHRGQKKFGKWKPLYILKLDSMSQIYLKGQFRFFSFWGPEATILLVKKIPFGDRWDILRCSIPEFANTPRQSRG